MMKLHFLFFFLFLVSCSPKNPLTKAYPNHKHSVTNFIKIIENDDAIQLSQITKFPLQRESPLTPLVDDIAIVDRYDEIFDQVIKTKIINSDPLKDWSIVGSEGIKLSGGDVWLNHDGQLIAVNYQSAAEKEKIKTLREKQNTKLHPSVSTYEKPILEMTTKSYHIRIDDLGGNNYRYTSWKIGKSLMKEPDLIIEGAEVKHQGNSGNRSYVFINGDYEYEVKVIKMGPRDGPLGRLEVLDKSNHTIILEEDAATYKD